jgi:hypothetical protein
MHDLFFTFQPLVPLRAQAADAAEMASQLLFGDVVACIARDRQWLHVRNMADGYTGWIDEKAVLGIDQAWLDGIASWDYVLQDQCAVQTRRAGATLPARLGLGSRIPALPHKQLEIGDWSADLTACPAQVQPTGDVDAVMGLSERYLGVPYLWGGKSLAGIDCSGLTQMVYAMAGRQLPRDARDQAACGTAVDYAGRKAGDLAFFQNASGKVHHVGIVLPDGNVRHASGHVHDATLLEDGIVGRYTGHQTHRLCSIKRII